MPEATIYTGAVTLSESGNAVVVEALLLEGNLAPGMFLNVPLNRSVSISLPIAEVNVLPDGSACIVVDNEGDPELAEVTMALNFSDETLDVTWAGEM